MTKCSCSFSGGDRDVRSILAQSISGIRHSSHFDFYLDWIGLEGLLRAFLQKKRSMRILIRLETSTTNPIGYARWYTNLFGKIIDICDGRPTFWPVSFNAPGLPFNRTRLGRAVMIQADKLSLSKGELYSLRRQIADSNDVDLFGIGWDRPLILRIRIFLQTILISLIASNLKLKGARRWFRRRAMSPKGVPDKNFLLQKYKVCLVVENDLAKVTEKLLEALLAGCKVVYVGPTLSSRLYPVDLIATAGTDPQEISKKLQLALNEDSESYFRRLENWVAKASQLWPPLIDQGIEIAEHIIDSAQELVPKPSSNISPQQYPE